ncbi:uncharacterized protein LOC120005389 isoform X3 [Tripterygium wilfordii]|uniref:uncharacterized protein LOC120005389 isoform X3 n=1 Tax=Tripterygium wilfordii TaxID=458696 RepID=UPI0018F7F610|nr:uncharacterized protein LOC120005389 isoform X3 [Tripterygium wilfordii]
MMRFRKGTIVDVLDRREDPSGVWRPAKIISGNGHYYSVRYDCSIGMKDKPIAGKVSRKAIRPRPCPPPVDGRRGWVAGDLVEVYDDCAWKAARILKGVGGNCYEIRQLSSLKEFRVHKVNIRDRQLWQDEKWIVRKGLGSCRNVKARKTATESENSFQKIAFPLQQANPNANVQPRYTGAAALDNPGCQESHIVSARTMKRAYPFSSSHVDTEGGKPNCFLHCFCARSSECNDSDADDCSVGSCSVISYNSCKLSGRTLAGLSQDSDTLSSDAESFCGREEEEKCSHPLREGVEATIHRLELHAYRCTLNELYAFGPLSWDQEAMLTDLRLSLHISNDEHLIALRNLISGGTNIHVG